MTKHTHVVLAMGALALAIHADAKDFQIGAYCLKSYAQTEQHIRDIRDCHVDFVVGIDYLWHLGEAQYQQHGYYHQADDEVG